MSIPKSIAVLGAGVTGLAAAHRLAAAGHRVTVLERDTRIGGAVGTERIDDWLIERGPNSLLAGRPELGSLLSEIGLDKETLGAAPAAGNRYIVRGGRLVPLPSGPGALPLTPLFSLRARLGLLAEPFRRYATDREDVAFGPFMQEHVGREIVEYAVQPFVSGIYAGDANRLSTRWAFPKLWLRAQMKGSLLLGQIAVARDMKRRGIARARQHIVSFREGLQVIPQRLASGLPDGAIRLGATPTLIKPAPCARWVVSWDDSSGGHEETFDKVLSALPAASLADLAIGSPEMRPLSALAGIEQPPVSSLFLGFRREHVAHPLDGFGALAPPVERNPFLGVLFSSALFPGRAPAGHVALTVLAGGSLQPDNARRDPDELWRLVKENLQALLGVTGEPVFSRLTHWPRAIPQYNLGYGRYLDAMEACEREHPGLLIGGQVRNGISLPDCLLAGVALAKRAVQ
jgi:oxygen-dependent protoporphyrinogen oxidase